MRPGGHHGRRPDPGARTPRPRWSAGWTRRPASRSRAAARPGRRPGELPGVDAGHRATTTVVADVATRTPATVLAAPGRARPRCDGLPVHGATLEDVFLAPDRTGVPRMSSSPYQLCSPARCCWASSGTGPSLFFTILFPLMFLVLFGGIFTRPEPPQSHVDRGRVGRRSSTDLAADAGRPRRGASRSRSTDDAAAALDEGPQGRRRRRDRAERRHAHRCATRPPTRSRPRTYRASSARSSTAPTSPLPGTPPTLLARPAAGRGRVAEGDPVRDPGAARWAVATGAAFGAALTLVPGGRSKLLRRLRLSPVPAPGRSSAPGSGSAW